MLFGIILRLHQVQLKGVSILHVIHIVGKRMTEAGIDGLSRKNNLVIIMIVVNPLKLVPVDEGVVERSPGLEGWIRSWW